MSNFKFVVGAVKRRGITIAAAVAVAGGSLATANYASAAETEPSFDELQQELHGTQAGNTAAKTAQEVATALKDGASDDQLKKILSNGLKSAAGDSDGGFTQEDLHKFDEQDLNAQLQAVVDSAKQTVAKKGSSQGDQSAAPHAPAQNPADWAAPAPKGDPSPQRLEAEFGNTTEGMIAGETAKLVAKALRTTGDKQELQKIVEEGLKKAGFDESLIAQHQGEIDAVITESFHHYNETNLELQVHKQAAIRELSSLSKLNPLQRDIFQKDIESADNLRTVNTVLAAANAENKNPVQQFAPAPGKTGEKSDVEKALEYTKKEALQKLESFTFLTQQQKDAYKQQVEAATQVYEVEAAFETGEAKNTANKAAKEATNFVGKALARTKQLALKQLDEMTGLNHEQKRQARNKILAAKQVFEVEAAFHTAEKLNSAKK